MAQKILGIDLGAHSVKAVLLESTYRGFVVLDHARAEVPASVDDPPTPALARQLAALEDLLRARGWAFDEAAVALPGAGTAAHVVTLPFTDLRRIEQTVAFEVEGQIPFELSAVAWDWQPLSTREGRTDLLVGVTRREEVQALLAGLGPLGIDPRMVLPAAPAYAALAAAGVGAGVAPAEGAPQSEAGATLVLDLGAERTSLCLVGPTGCEAARTVPLGAAQLARGMARALDRPEAEAHQLLAAEAALRQAQGERPLGSELPPELAALASDPRAGDALRAALAPLLRELRATVRAWQARVGPRRVVGAVLCGELGTLAGLPELLAPEVEGPVVPLALPAATAGALGPADAPAFGLALALALRAHQGARGGRLNLRRGDLAFTRDFEHLKGRVVQLAAYAGLILLLAVVSAGVKTFALSRQEALLDKALCDAEQKIMGKCFANFEEAQAVFRGRGSAGAALPKATAVDLLAELSQRVPAEVKLRLERIDVTRDKLHLEGTTDTAESVDKVVAGLRASRCFADAHSGAARKRTDGKFEFSVDATLGCLETGVAGAAAEGVVRRDIP
jgi:general secretion pathway protein L